MKKNDKTIQKIHLSRSEEAQRQEKVYKFYNVNALQQLKAGILLTDFKDQIAKKFSYANYQTIANLISKRDSKRRADIHQELDLARTYLFSTLKITSNSETENIITVKTGIFTFELCVKLKFDTFPNPVLDSIFPEKVSFPRRKRNDASDDGIPDYGITHKSIKIYRAYQGDDLMYLSRTDKKYTEEFFLNNLLFDLVPN